MGSGSLLGGLFLCLDANYLAHFSYSPVSQLLLQRVLPLNHHALCFGSIKDNIRLDDTIAIKKLNAIE